MFGRNRRILSINSGNGNVAMPMVFRIPIIKTIAPMQPVLYPREPERKKMTWGEPTWFFLHTIAEKVKPESFAIIRGELLQHIYNICVNLPCPLCAKHAKMHLDSINFSIISSKDELKMMLFTFHNIINSRKNYPLFSLEDLDVKYSLANIGKIFRHFIYHFTDSYRAPGMIADDLFRKQLSKKIIEWFNNNENHFM
jgi:hypothetical protein